MVEKLRDTLQGDSWTSLKLDPAFFCLRDFTGRLIGMTFVHVDDMLLATNNSVQAESHISRLLSKYEIKDVKMADDDGGVLYFRTVPDDMKPGGLALQQDQMEFVRARCEPARMSRVRARQEGAQCTTRRNSRDAECGREFALGNLRNTSRRVFRDLKGQVELGVVSTVKFVHTYQKLATPVNVPVQIGCGLTLSCMCAAQELFGLGCPFCGRPDEGVTNQILDSKPNTNVSPEFLSESLWTSLCWQTSVPPKWWSFFRTVLCRVAHSFSPIPSDLWRTVEMTVETRVVDQQ